MHGPGEGQFEPFRSLAICLDEKSGGAFVFKCGDGWDSLADDWYESVDHALRGVEAQYPGIDRVLVRR